MRRSLSMLCLVAVFLAVLDLIVAAGLGWAEQRGKLGSLVRYFDYGRSVPGKIERWEAMDARQYDFGWMGPILAASREKALQSDDEAAPVIHTYGMSFVNNIMAQLAVVAPDLAIDLHSGPAAPPNYTYALFLDDAENRRAGDVAILGILSSSIPAMAALGNRTWAFEQPLPFTYPIFRPDGSSLRRIEPLITSASAERAVTEQPETNSAWMRQLAQEDLFYSPITFGAAWLDHSPFARMVRRSLAKGHIERTEASLLSGAFPYTDVLGRIIAGFSETSRQTGQIPVVMLIQTRDLSDLDVLRLTTPFLQKHNIPYFATAEHFDPSDPSGFIGDGHYRKDVDQRFAKELREMLVPLMRTDKP